ncbi:hypothetical protein DT076_11210 [Desertihabitans brevis]|uniref:M23ase beta-sheet core domain-containing protein n=1 Tax=Desertihabitans brevis TaxID=2268447 RepID=A0A367YWR0_9ACTN|nr:M23 family metallopeptidase [Desertihabitans brevis]RCK69442.1 hypothetical protein DT076_11210 [Desertihabitans brevis]
MLLSVAAGAVGLSLCLSTAQADDLTDRRDELQRQEAQTQHELNESTEGLNDAVAALQAAEADLSAAEERLAQTQVELAAAEQLDAEMQEKLDLAQEELEKAKVAVADNQLALDEQKAAVGEVVREEYQQRTNLIGVAMLLQTESQSDLQTKMQWSTTMFDTAEAGMDRLRTLQQKLQAAEQRRTEIEEQVAADREQAAANLVVKQDLEAQAETQRAEVADLVAASDSARRAAEEEVAADQRRYDELVNERKSVEQRIAERIAAQKAEEERRAREAREAREAEERAARERAEAQQKSSSSKKSSPSKKSAPKKSAPKKSANEDTSFIMPVSGPITSKYGMRLHPVLGYWKLHDGTDFGAGCGTPIKAPYDGRVSERYFNAGYGNRLLIDHGKVRGSYITTAFNHATKYTVGVGDRVSKGQVIGYVGSTGYSTGCHLHLMTWKDGTMINPMSWF